MKLKIFFSRILVVSLVTALIGAFCSEMSTPRAEEVILGDVSGDGNITSVDVSLTLQIANGILSPTADQRSAADADQDGDVTLADAEMILQCAAEKCSAFTWTTIGPGGGTLETDDLTITIPPDTFPEEATIAIRTLDPYPIQYENLDALGSFYQLENFSKIHGPITIEISFDPNMISAEDSVYIYQEEKSFITGGVGEAQSGRPRLDTEVDRQNGTATIQIVPYETNPATVSSINLIKTPEHQGSYLSNAQDTMNVGAVTSSAHTDLLEVKDAFFHIKDVENISNIQFRNNIWAFLDSARKKLESLGFYLSKEEKELPMPVYITNNLDSQDITVPAEAVRPSIPIYQACYSYMNIKPGYNDDQYRVFTGHELFHIIQWLHGAYSTFSSDYQYVWLREASSTWFETKLSPQGANFISQKARENSKFIYAPLEKEDEDHGYGASSFLTYLTDGGEYDDNLILTIYQKIKNDEDNDKGIGALQAALGSSDKLSELFLNFAFKFISKTTGHANWPEPGPPPGGEVQLYPGITPPRYTPNLFPLSAWNVILNPPTSGSPFESYKLVVSLEEGNQFIKGAVYTRDRGSTTWQLTCEISPGATCEVAQFFSKKKKRSANVILVNQQAASPSNQGVPVTLNLEVKEQLNSIVGTWNVTKYDYLCQGFFAQTGELLIKEDHTYEMYLSEGIVEDFEGTWFLGRESALGGSLMAYFHSDDEPKFQAFVNETYDEITNDWLMSGASIVCVHAKKISDTVPSPFTGVY
jgi:hypothetical protein